MYEEVEAAGLLYQPEAHALTICQISAVVYDQSIVS